MSPQRFGQWLAIKLARILRSVPGEDGLAEYQCDDPHDPQVQRRSIPDDNFNFERWKP